MSAPYTQENIVLNEPPHPIEVWETQVVQRTCLLVRLSDCCFSSFIAAWYPRGLPTCSMCHKPVLTMIMSGCSPPAALQKQCGGYTAASHWDKSHIQGHGSDIHAHAYQRYGYTEIGKQHWPTCVAKGRLRCMRDGVIMAPHMVHSAMQLAQCKIAQCKVEFGHLHEEMQPALCVPLLDMCCNIDSVRSPDKGGPDITRQCVLEVLVPKHYFLLLCSASQQCCFIDRYSCV